MSQAKSQVPLSPEAWAFLANPKCYGGPGFRQKNLETEK